MLEVETAPRVLTPNSDNRDWLAPEEVAQLTAPELVSRLEGLEGFIAEHAREAELERRPVDEVFSAIRRTGVFYLYVPKRHGGVEERSLQSYIDVVLPIARACASTAWCTAFSIQQQFIIAQFSERTQEEVWGRFPYITAAGSGFPPGTAVEVEGGLQVSGRWKWCSGVMHAGLANLIALKHSAEGPPVAYSCYVPVEEVTVLDTWSVDGVCASGSHDMVAEEIFIPEHMTHEFRLLSAGQLHHENPLYRLPLAPFLAMTTAIPVLGAAQGVLGQFEKRITGGGGNRKLEDKEMVHVALGKGQLEIRTAEMVIRDAAREFETLAARDEHMSVEDRIRIRAQFAYASNLCREAAREMLDLAGSSMHFLDNPMQRMVRDINVMTTHAILDISSSAELLGRVGVGLPSNHDWFK